MTNQSDRLTERSALTPEATYRQRSDRFAAQAADCGRHEGRLIWARSITFLAGVGALLMGYLDPNGRPAWIAVGIVLIVVFLVFAVLDDWFKRRRDHLLLLQQVNQWQLARKQRRWDAVAVPEVEVPSAHVAVSKDLDVFGRASLFHLLCLANTPCGISTLRDWILEPALPEEIAQRQHAVRELTPEVTLREELVLRGQMLSRSLAGPEAFVKWVESEPLLARYPWLVWVSRIVPIVGVVALMLLAGGSLSVEVGATLIITVLILNCLVCIVFTGRMHEIFNSISTRNGEMRHYRALFELIREIPGDSAHLARIRQMVVEEDGGVLRQLSRLNRVVKLAALRHDPWLSVFYFGLQATVLWDFHVLWLLERWQRRCQRRVRPWFEALGELESLFSLSGLTHDHPTWCFPKIESCRPHAVRCKGIGHPLLSDATRVVNDVEVGPSGTVLLVTGSNMSGKSTLLRAIGLSGMLAQAGGPVCAESLQMPPLTVTTSIRIDDSLQDGISFFMAELHRLKLIVDQATTCSQQENRTLLYLLDEVLLGTNSVERHLAVARVLAHLVEQGAIGAVSTHDLELAGSPELIDCCRAVHFRETLHAEPTGQRMSFDYRLHEGIATTTNALKLLELVGLTGPKSSQA